MEISELHIYPIKSLGGISLSQSEVDLTGLKYDRRWMLTDENNVFLTQRTFAELSGFEVKINLEYLIVTDKKNKNSINIPLIPETQKLENIQIWNDTLKGQLVSDKANEFFSDLLKSNIKLFFQPEDSIRKIDAKYQKTGMEITSLSDGYPILMVSEESLEYLNQHCNEHIPMDRFRPNIVIKGVNPFFEDDIFDFNIGEVHLRGVKPCARCIVITIDQKTSEKGKEPLLTLSKIRKMNNKILFGQNVVVYRPGLIKVGEKLNLRSI
ncbi:MOSC domain-containing protein [Lacihabitans sp. LS3-19]|uniref:MOSC domain-containing protein n=1 Tax=Lacihabitans sp. LS3-19 TaxID=2487335 RepID=UPI0020CC50B8|nr:MOSC N-terminal beta barrel domain-containing protein [Lacihabitans sp. LS3-19]MCP9769834.1 MOSC domain-containing protein [Lacihabitans sp. LS3-19]